MYVCSLKGWAPHSSGVHTVVYVLQAYGEIRTLYTACKARGLVTVSYFDLRAACLAMHSLAGAPLGDALLEVQYPVPSEQSAADREEVRAHCMLPADPPAVRPFSAWLWLQLGYVSLTSLQPNLRRCRPVTFLCSVSAASAISWMAGLSTVCSIHIVHRS
jgi:hypothetical protein